MWRRRCVKCRDTSHHFGGGFLQGGGQDRRTHKDHRTHHGRQDRQFSRGRHVNIKIQIGSGAEMFRFLL